MQTEVLFGSRVRARALEALAATPKPLSAYRVARAADAQPIQVLNLLKQLVPLVERTRDGWVLRNEALRQFLREEVGRREQVVRAEKDALLSRLGMRTSFEHGRRRAR